jgi:uncharacterized protein (TIGR03086 family)
VVDVIGDQMSLLGDAEQLWVSALTSATGSSLDDASGCPGWSLRDLVNHVTGGGLRYAMLLEGATAAATATTRELDFVGDDPVAEFWRHEKRFRQAVDTADLDLEVDHRAGRRPGRELVTMRIMDLVLHTHDLSRGVGVDWDPPEPLTEHLLTDGATVIDGLRDMGLFGSAITPVSDDPRDRLLAFTGRPR